MGKRVWRPWDTHPKDGTPFVVGFIFRINPFTGHFESLRCDHEAESKVWVPTAVGCTHGPKFWAAPPRPVDAPTGFTVEYAAEIERQTLIAKVTGHIWRRCVKDMNL